MRLPWRAMLAMAVLPAVTQAATLARVSDPWRYFKCTNAPSSPATAWRQPGFDDSAWGTATGGFFVGQSFELTSLLQDMPSHYLSACFRMKFTVSDPGAIRWLLLRIDYDDGFVAYLNGTEVARRGFAPEATVSFDTPAAPAGHAWGEEINLTRFTNLLGAGDNLLAIELHNSSLQDGTAALVAELVANFSRGPIIQNVSSNSAQVIWRTPVPADSKLEFGTNNSLGSVQFDTNLVTTHVVTLIHLPPDTAYSYRASR